jgi:hypothetical protein
MGNSQRTLAPAAMHDRGDLAAGAHPGQAATATLAALQGGPLLTQIRRSTEPLEAALDTVLAHVASLIVALVSQFWTGTSKTIGIASER